MEKKEISIIGAGYVGLCTAVGFASRGFGVVVSDVDSNKVSKINRGEAPFHEPKLQEKLLESLKAGHLVCLENQTGKAVLATDMTFIAVGTPSMPDGSINLQFIKDATKDIAEGLKQKSTYHVVAVKSTVIPGTTQEVVKETLEKESGKQCGGEIGLCMNPEFLRQGSAFYDTIHADRVIIGAHDKKAGDTLENLYRRFYAEELPPVLRTTLATAELIKYASNALLATKISFINMIANICEQIPSADVTVVAKGIGMDKRIGSLFLEAGLGYGGSCFPKDTKALLVHSKKLGYDPLLLDAAEKINQNQPLRAAELCKKLLGSLKDKQIAILGLSFKPDTDDMREARVIPIINRLIEENAKIVAYDPVAMPMAKKIFQEKIKYAASAFDCLKNSDACILVTEWEEFRKLKPSDFLEHMKHANLVDGRRIYDVEEFEAKMRFAAIGLGRE